MMGRRALAAGLAGLLLVASALPLTGQLSGTYTLDPKGSGPRNHTTWGAAVQALAAGVNDQRVGNSVDPHGTHPFLLPGGWAGLGPAAGA